MRKRIVTVIPKTAHAYEGWLDLERAATVEVTPAACTESVGLGAWNCDAAITPDSLEASFTEAARCFRDRSGHPTR